MGAKDAVREKYLNLRRQLPAEERRAANLALQKRLRHFLAERSGVTLCYQPMSHEADPFQDQTNALWAYPRVEGDDMAAYFAGPSRLSKSSLGVLEPDPRVSKPVDPAELDVVLVPGVAFDRSGHRLGRGRGFYDRFLKSSPRHVCRVGIAFSAQVSTEELPVEPWDEVMDWILTEDYALHVKRKDQWKSES